MIFLVFLLFQKATNVLNALKKKQKQSLSNPNQSLELLRLNIQYSFDLEIDQLMKKYVQLFFLPAIANINSIQEGENVSESQVKVYQINHIIRVLMKAFF